MKVDDNRPIAANASAKYKAEVPDSIRTPDTVETRTLGTLHFFDGMPSADTVAKIYDYLDVARAPRKHFSPVFPPRPPMRHSKGSRLRECSRATSASPKIFSTRARCS